MMITSAESKRSSHRMNARKRLGDFTKLGANIYLGSSAAALDESGLTIFFHCVPVCFSRPNGPSAQVVPVARRTLFRNSWLSVRWSFQVSPASSLTRKPSSVVIQPRFAASKPMELSQADAEVFLAYKVTPP